MTAVTIKDVALSRSILRHCFTRSLWPPRHLGRFREKVQAVAKELGFVPNAQARSLRSTKTDTIALLISDVRNPYFSDLAHAVEQQAHAAGSGGRFHRQRQRGQRTARPIPGRHAFAPRGRVDCRSRAWMEADRPSQMMQHRFLRNSAGLRGPHPAAAEHSLHYRLQHQGAGRGHREAEEPGPHQHRFPRRPGPRIHRQQFLCILYSFH